MTSPHPAARPLVAHVLYRFDTGGLENGVVNLIDRLVDFRHMVIAMTEVTDFKRRVGRDDVVFEAMHKPPGHGWQVFPSLWRSFRRWKPAIVHTRNLAALEAQVPAWLAGVPVRLHGEHGRDVGDLDGSNVRMQRVRRLYSPFVHRYTAVSKDLASYLVNPVGISAGRVEQIYNGVDTERFTPGRDGPTSVEGCPFDPARHWIVGAVGRLQAVKNQTLLARAFVEAAKADERFRQEARLVIVGGGALLEQIREVLHAADLASCAWLPGERGDVPAVMRALHLFVLPSLAEGISNTILEAMASGVPVLATAVGGNVELVEAGVTGDFVPSADVEAMATALLQRFRDREGTARMGRTARQVAERQFSLSAMVNRYARLYEGLLARRGLVPEVMREGHS